jgi:hypothetical protein
VCLVHRSWFCDSAAGHAYALWGMSPSRVCCTAACARPRVCRTRRLALPAQQRIVCLCVCARARVHCPLTGAHDAVGTWLAAATVLLQPPGQLQQPPDVADR